MKFRGRAAGRPEATEVMVLWRFIGICEVERGGGVDRGVVSFATSSRNVCASGSVSVSMADDDGMDADPALFLEVTT